MFFYFDLEYLLIHQQEVEVIDSVLQKARDQENNLIIKRKIE
jgi:hypothetical protein